MMAVSIMTLLGKTILACVSLAALLWTAISIVQIRFPNHFPGEPVESQILRLEDCKSRVCQIETDYGWIPVPAAVLAEHRVGDRLPLLVWRHPWDSQMILLSKCAEGACRPQDPDTPASSLF